LQPRRGSFLSFSADLASSGDDISELVTNLNQLVKSLQEVSVDLDRALKGSDAKLRQAINSLSASLGRAGETAETISRETDRLSRSLRSGVDVVVVDINNLAKDLSRAAQSVTSAMDRLDNPKALIAGPNAKSLGPGERLRE